MPSFDCPDDPDLILCLRFEGTANDDSRYSVNTVLSGGSFVQGLDGLALDLTPGTILRIPESPLLAVDYFTIEMSVRPRTLPLMGNRMALGDRDPDPRFRTRRRPGSRPVPGPEGALPPVGRPVGRRPRGRGSGARAEAREGRGVQVR